MGLTRHERIMSLPAASNLGRVGGAQMLILWRHVLAAWFLVAATIGVIGEGHAQNAAGTWPHTITMPNATVVVYQPQAIAWPNHEKLTARAALAITRKGEQTPIVGTVQLSIATRVDAATGDVK